MEGLLFTVVTLCALGVLSAVILYFVARKFRVEEDPRIDDVEKMLPAANCGGCGFAGCRGLADALVRNDDISALYCPVGGKDCMKAVAAYLGKVAPVKDPEAATVCCGGTCEKRACTNIYNGAKSCVVASSLYVGETGCSFGCLGYGDCVVACAFDAILMNPATGLPEVDPDKCTACAACVKACPKMIIELRKKWPKNRAVYVSCVSRDKGAVVMKACKAGCIGCSKCLKVCPFDAITIDNNLAYIDPVKCKLCRKCVNECPTGAIVLANMEPLPKEIKVPAEPKLASAPDKADIVKPAHVAQPVAEKAQGERLGTAAEGAAAENTMQVLTPVARDNAAVKTAAGNISLGTMESSVKPAAQPSDAVSEAESVKSE